MHYNAHPRQKGLHGSMKFIWDTNIRPILILTPDKIWL